MKLLKKIPNWLTMIRIFLIPAFVVLMHDPSPLMVKIALGVFVVACLTDLFDGYIARRFRAVTDLGKLLDPLADKILVMTALVMLAALRSELTGEGWVPGWLVVLVLAREIWVTGIRGVAAAQGIVVAAKDSGKIKSFLQMVSITLLLLHDTEIPLWNFSVPAQYLGLNLLFVSLAFSYWSGFEYTRDVVLKSKNLESSVESVENIQALKNDNDAALETTNVDVGDNTSIN